MPDVFSDLDAVEPETVAAIGDILEARSQMASQQKMVQSYLSQIEFPADARVLEVGCGTGPVCRTIAQRPDVGEVVGLEPSTVLLDRARILSQELANITYVTGDGYEIDYPDGSFDVVVLHTLLSHVDQPDRVLAESQRLLGPEGYVAICDGDFSTLSVAISENDPLQRCVEAFAAENVTNPFLVRQLVALVAQAGFAVGELESHGLVETTDPLVTLSWVDRGADALVAAGRVTPELGEGYKNEARTRVRNGTWFGYTAYATLVSQPS